MTRRSQGDASLILNLGYYILFNPTRKNHSMSFLKPYFMLCRVNISLFAACSTATGFFLAPGPRAAGVISPFLAVFFLACGASALNQFQEHDIDSRMERTRGRPVPSGIVS